MSKNGEKNNQLTSASECNVKNIIISEPRKENVPGSSLAGLRMNISVLNKDKTVGDLILPTERLFSFGVSENKSQETKQVIGHTLPLCLWNKDGPSKEEKQWTDKFNEIVEHIKQHLVENREALELYDLSLSDLKNLNPLYWKKDKGKIVEGTGPTLYAKLISSRKNGGKIMSMFYNSRGELIEPLSVLQKYCYVKAAIKIESIYYGAKKFSLQVKVYEADIELLDQGMKPLMSRPKPVERVLTGASTTMNDIPTVDDDAGSIHGSDTEEKVPEVKKEPALPAAKKPALRRTINKPK